MFQTPFLMCLVTGLLMFHLPLTSVLGGEDPVVETSKVSQKEAVVKGQATSG